MEPRIDIVTLGVRDLAASRAFYIDGLGWPALVDVPGEVVFIQIGHGLLLSLFGIDHLAAEAPGVDKGTAPPPLSLGHIVAQESDVAAVLDRAVAAGATLVAPPTRRDWGGLTGYFADPDGIHWEIAHNPGFRVSVDGTVSIGPVD